MFSTVPIGRGLVLRTKLPLGSAWTMPTRVPSGMKIETSAPGSAVPSIVTLLPSTVCAETVTGKTMPVVLVVRV